MAASWQNVGVPETVAGLANPGAHVARFTPPATCVSGFANPLPDCLWNPDILRADGHDVSKSFRKYKVP